MKQPNTLVKRDVLYNVKTVFIYRKNVNHFYEHPMSTYLYVFGARLRRIRQHAGTAQLPKYCATIHIQ